MIHREGRKISAIIALTVITIDVLVYILAGFSWVFWLIMPATLLFLVFILRFFRDPGRKGYFEDGVVYAPADGKIVVIENTKDHEYLEDERIQVSIFMSVWNVHINWYPLAGKLSYYKYHPGKYLIARHPKSSIMNERNTVVVKTSNGTEILLRQIAGAVARRIISYAEAGKSVAAGDEMGFIRFGSRVDVFLPADAEILVEKGQKSRGQITPLAVIKLIN